MAMERADFRTIKSRQFVGDCPTSFDGQETIYTFHLSTGEEVIDTCSVEIRPDDPLFSAVEAALGSTLVPG